MTAIKAHQVQAFLAKPDPRFGAVLFYGTDAGLVSERAARFAQHFAQMETPPGEILRVDDAVLEMSPDALSIELRTLPMFGGRKIVRALAGRRLNAKVLEPLVQEAPLAGFLIVEAGNLKPGEALRTLFEKAAAAAAVPCFRDEGKDLAAMIREVFDGAGLKIAPDAHALLLSRLGADRALSRQEVEKLALYAAGQKEVTAADVEAITGDATGLVLDAAPEAAAAGDAGSALDSSARAVASGEGAQAVIAATQRYFLRLHHLRAAIERGQTFEEAARGLRPPLHFKQQDILARQSRAWTRAKLNQALRAIAEAAKTARLNSQLEDTIAERLLLDLARLAARASQGKA